MSEQDDLVRISGLTFDQLRGAFATIPEDSKPARAMADA